MPFVDYLHARHILPCPYCITEILPVHDDQRTISPATGSNGEQGLSYILLPFGSWTQIWILPPGDMVPYKTHCLRVNTASWRMPPHSSKAMVSMLVPSKGYSITPPGCQRLGGALRDRASGFHGHIPTATPPLLLSVCLSPMLDNVGSHVVILSTVSPQCWLRLCGQERLICVPITVKMNC